MERRKETKGKHVRPALIDDVRITINKDRAAKIISAYIIAAVRAQRLQLLN
jgi:hypothetical protein